MFYIGMIVLSMIIILIFLFGEVIGISTPNTKSNEKSTNKKSKEGTFNAELLGKSSGAFKFKHGGKTYLLKTSDILILDTLKDGGKFAIKYEKIKSDSSRNKVYGKILGAKKV